MEATFIGSHGRRARLKRPRPGHDHRTPKMTISNLSEAERNPAQIGIR
jgi:hypothetical protein